MDADDISDAFIRTVAVEVRGHGMEYEEKLQEREKANPKYAFMLKDVCGLYCGRSEVQRADTCFDSIGGIGITALL